MKTTRLLSVLMGLAVSLGMTSCLNDDNNDNTNTGLTKEQQYQCYLQMAGQYSGRLYYYKDMSINPKADSADVSWAVTNDSTIMAYSVPGRALASLVNNPKLKEAIEAADDVDLEMRYAFYSNSPIAYMTYPLAVKMKVNYDNADHDVTLHFIYNNYSWGQFTAGTRAMEFQAIQYGIYVDNLQTSYLNTQAPLIFRTK